MLNIFNLFSIINDISFLKNLHNIHIVHLLSFHYFPIIFASNPMDFVCLFWFLRQWSHAPHSTGHMATTAAKLNNAINPGKSYF